MPISLESDFKLGPSIFEGQPALNSHWATTVPGKEKEFGEEGEEEYNEHDGKMTQMISEVEGIPWREQCCGSNVSTGNKRKFLGIFAEYFEGREEYAFEEFIARFETDLRGRDFIIPKVGEDGSFMDKDGNPTTDINQAVFEKVNPFDIAFNLYITQPTI